MYQPFITDRQKETAKNHSFCLIFYKITRSVIPGKKKQKKEKQKCLIFNKNTWFINDRQTKTRKICNFFNIFFSMKRFLTWPVKKSMTKMYNFVEYSTKISGL